MTQAFRFDPEAHKYYLGGEELISVTQSLKGAGFIDSQYYSDLGQTRGTYVHLACQFYDEGSLDESALDPVIKPYVDGYKLFRRETGFTPEEIERQRLHLLHKVAGTPDRVGRFPGRQLRAIVDIKSGPEAFWHPYQVNGGYRMLCTTPQEPDFETYGLYLRSDATYRLKCFTDRPNQRQDLTVFMAAVTVARVLKEKGGKNGA